MLLSPSYALVIHTEGQELCPCQGSCACSALEVRTNLPPRPAGIPATPAPTVEGLCKAGGTHATGAPLHPTTGLALPGGGSIAHDGKEVRCKNVLTCLY